MPKFKTANKYLNAKAKKSILSGGPKIHFDNVYLETWLFNNALLKSSFLMHAFLSY